MANKEKQPLDFLENTLREAVFQCYNNADFVREYNRLTKSKIKENKSPIEHMIDEATGKSSAELNKFIDFVQEHVVVPVVFNTIDSNEN